LISDSRFGSAKEYWGYYENKWVLRDVPDIYESSDKNEQDRYYDLLRKNVKKPVKVH
jgi:hypothetical protein